MNRLRPQEKGIARWMLIAGIAVGVLFIVLSVWALTRAPRTPNTQSSSSATGSPTLSTQENKGKTEKNTTGIDSTTSPPNKKYSVIFPEGWVKRTCKNSPSMLLLAPRESLLGTCDGQKGGMVKISRLPGDVRVPQTIYLRSTYYAHVEYSEITHVNMSGYSIHYIVGRHTAIDDLLLGSRKLEYILYNAADNTTYQLTYQQEPTTPTSRDSFVAIVASLTPQ